MIVEPQDSTLQSLERKNSSKKKYREKVSSVQAMINERTVMLLASQRRIASIWFITSVIWIFTSMNNRPEKISRGIGDSVYLYASSIFFMGAFLAYMGYKVSKNDDKKRLSEILLIVNAIAMLSYLLQFLRVTPSLRDVNGYPVDFARYFEWLATCPTFISLISTLTRDSDYGRKTIAFDYMLLAAGFFGSILRSPYTYISLGVALAMFTQVITGLKNMFGAAIEGKTKCGLDKVSLSAARAVTLFSWTCFPIIFFSVRFKVVSYGLGELLFAIADVLSKVFVTILLVNASVEEIQNDKVQALVGIAEEMSVDLDKTEDLLGRMMPEEYLNNI
jgi:bacteriorhodopsin